MTICLQYFINTTTLLFLRSKYASDIYQGSLYTVHPMTLSYIQTDRKINIFINTYRR
uniref:Uncharacterized protein n=1 Tax=Lepeophtheirus salmonis TaxID=72036 RepID=A0A0K2UXR0_LEPSM